MASRARRTSARIFELLARTAWLAFLLGCLLAEAGVWGWRGTLALDATVLDRTEAMLIALAFAGAVLEALVPLAFVWRRRVPLGAQGGSLAGATGDIIAVCAWPAAAGFLLALSLRATLGAAAMLTPVACGIGASMALWLLVKLHAWSEPPAQKGMSSPGGPAWLCHALTTALLWALYLPVAWPCMLAARLRRMLREPLYYQCPQCTFRSANPAIAVELQPEQVRTWPTVDAPLLVRPVSADSRLLPTWRGLDTLVTRDGHQRYVAFFRANACAGLCQGAFGRRILVLGESGAELAAVQAAIHRAASGRLTPDPPASQRAAAFAHAAAEGRWAVVSADGARLRIQGDDPGGPGRRGVVDIEVVGDFRQRIDGSACHAVVVLPSRATDASADPCTYLASRLAQLRTPPAAPPPPDKPRGGLARALLLRLLGPAETGDRSAGDTSSRTVVFLPRDRAGECPGLEAFGVHTTSDADELVAFLEKVLQ